MALFDKLDSLAPAYLMRRRSGDLIALASQDVETVEYFFAHTVAPALVAVLVPSAVLIALAVVAWPIALALLPFVLFAALAPVLTRAHIDHLGAQARDALGLMSAYITETIQGLADLVAFQAVTGRRRNFIELVRGYQKIRLELLADLSAQTARLETVTGLGGLAVAIVGARLAAEHHLLADYLAPADPDRAVVVSADIGNRQCQPAARGYNSVDPPALRRAPRTAGGCRWAAATTRAQGRLGDPL